MTLAFHKKKGKKKMRDFPWPQIMLFMLIFNNPVNGNLTIMDETSISYE